MNYTEIGTMMKKAALYDKMVKKAQEQDKTLPQGVGSYHDNGIFTLPRIPSAKQVQGMRKAVKPFFLPWWTQDDTPMKTTFDPSLAHPRSYLAMLYNKGSLFPYYLANNRKDMFRFIGDDDLARARAGFADQIAKSIAPQHTHQYRQAYNKLVQQGKRKQKQYENTATVTPTTQYNNPKSTLNPQQKKLLLQGFKQIGSRNTSKRFNGYT